MTEVQRLQGELDAVKQIAIESNQAALSHLQRAEAAESSLARVQQERDEFVKVAARVVIVNCFKCGQEYPQWSVLSSMTCPDCKVAAVEAARVCVWKAVEDEYYDTGCGHAYQFTVGGPTENHQKFCGYCGGNLKVDPNE